MVIGEIRTMQFVSKRAEVDKNVYLGKGVVILGPTIIKAGVIIEDFSIIGKPSMQELYKFRELSKTSKSYKEYDSVVQSSTIIEEDCIIGRNSAIYSGSHLRYGFECEDNTRIGWDTKIGEHTRVMYNALIYCWINIGHHCNISGFVCNDTTIGNYVSMYGQTVHSFRKYGNNSRDFAPQISDYVTVGFGSQIIGDVSIGEYSYIVSGSIVTRDVPPKTVVKEKNVQCSIDRWKGKLKDSYISSFKDLK